MTKVISYKQQQAANLQQQKLAEWGGGGEDNSSQLSTNFYSLINELPTTASSVSMSFCFLAIVKQHPPAHHPLDVCYYSVVDEPQLRSNIW
jgi:hypothetical protein